MKKILLLVAFLVALTAQADDVAINSTNFPDSNFRSYISSKFDKDGNGVLSDSERRAVTEIDVPGKSIRDLTGIKYFGYLTYLNCSNNSISSLDLSYKVNLKTLICSNNQITSIDLTRCDVLKILRCDYNKLTALNNLPKTLEELVCTSNNISGTLNVAYFSSLKLLWCSVNPITTVYAYSCSLERLGVINCTNLTKLYCYSNRLTELEMTGCTALEELYCNGNQLTSIGTLPDNVKIVECANNKFERLYFANKKQLESFDCSYNTSLARLELNNTALTSLNVMGCSSLKTLICTTGKLTKLSNLPNSLEYLECINHQLTELERLPNNIQYIDCNSNKFTTLTITGKSALTHLYLARNYNLKELNCSNNALTTLVLDESSAIETLNCSGNQLTDLYVNTMRRNLKSLDCSNNKITIIATVNEQILEAMKFMNISQNQIKAENMGKLISILPTRTSSNKGTLNVLNNTNASIPEGNEITDSQIATAFELFWVPQYYDGTDNTWKPFEIVSPTKVGDVNGDKKVDIEDVNAAINIILDLKQPTDYPGDADLIVDGKVDIEDVNAIINIILTSN
ncbi:MAG: leucine-rich repeat domain-containing protein [Muribaculaceae bacterium]|nr:leucine-rich repeat domain-containing protein [Muribaculaceae bacterium]